MSYKLSVIIPTYNGEKYIKECLNSLVNQTIGIENLEIIIIDDKSTDNTIKIIEEYKNKYPSFKILKQDKNQGPGAARNRGIKEAKGEYITFLDCDDFISKNTYQHCINIIENDKEIDMVIYKYELYNKENKLPEPDIHQEIYKENKIITKLTQYPEIIFSTSPWNKIYSRNLIPYLEFPSMLYEDNITSLKTLLNAKKVYLTTDVTYYYRLEEEKSSRSQKITIKNCLDLIESIKQILNLTNEYPGYTEFIKYLGLKFTYDIIFWMLNLNFQYSQRCKIFQQLKTITKEFNDKTLNDFEKQFPTYTLGNKEQIKDINKLNETEFLLKHLYMDKYINPVYTATVYIDTGNDYNTQDKVQIKYKEEEIINLEFNLEDYKNIEELRFDPIEGKYTEIQIEKIETQPPKKIEITNTNAKNQNLDEKQIFLTPDPQYILKGDLNNIKELKITFKLQIQNAEDIHNNYEGIIKNLHQEIQKLNIEINGLKYEINARDKIINNKNEIIESRDNTIKEITDSTSWKITKPIRKIKR